jgi:acetyl esterase/lipase
MFVEDGAAALTYVIENKYEISNNLLPVFAMGHSAGAHIAMSLGLNQQYLSKLGHSTDDIAGVIGLSGPYNFLPLSSARLLKIFPDAQKQSDAQPINFVDPEDPPVFLGHGDSDNRVWPGNSTSLAMKLKQFKVPHTLMLYKGVDHSGTLKPFVSFLGNNSSIPGDVIQFIEKHSPLQDKVDR